jgi:hypothetical protein
MDVNERGNLPYSFAGLEVAGWGRVPREEALEALQHKWVDELGLAQLLWMQPQPVYPAPVQSNIRLIYGRRDERDFTITFVRCA